jgi:hypothetical protein
MNLQEFRSLGSIINLTSTQYHLFRYLKQKYLLFKTWYQVHHQICHLQLHLVFHPVKLWASVICHPYLHSHKLLYKQRTDYVIYQ